MILNGASEYLCKPFEITLLKKQCAAILNRARLIYQAHYADTQTETLGNLFWVLDHALTHHDFDKAKRLAGTIKRIFPIHPNDDEQINLLKLEF